MLSITSRANLADTVAHFDSDLDGFQDFFERRSGLGCLLNVPLHAGFAISRDRDSDRDQFLLFLGQRSIGVRRLLHRQKTRVNFGLERDQSGMRRLASSGNLFEFLHGLHHHEPRIIGYLYQNSSRD
jgi:hypothetical protein